MASDCRLGMHRRGFEHVQLDGDVRKISGSGKTVTMLSEMARHDLESLRRRGFNPTDEEIVRLNDTALKLERGRDTTVVNHPRTGRAGSVVLHEPTVGGVEWWELYGKDAFILNSSRLYGYFFMLANCRDLEYLGSLKRPKDISRAVKSWKRTVDATEDELWRAMLYCRFGTNLPDISGPTEPEDTEKTLDAMWKKIIMVSGATGILPEDLKTCVDSELTGMLVQASLQSRIELKPCIAELYMEYKKTLRQIEDRCNGERRP